MKTIKTIKTMKTMKTLFTLSIFTVLLYLNGHGQTNVKETFSELPSKITVPLVKNCQINIDGRLSEGEWNGSSEYLLSENVKLHLLVNDGNLYIGLRYLKPCVETMSEIYLTISEKDFYDFHASSAACGGVNAFSGELKAAKFSGKDLKDWIVNSPAGSGGYDKAFWEIREYKISLSLLAFRPLKMAGGMMIIVNKTGTERERVSFPKGYSFGNSNNWVELVLPNNE